MDMPWGPEMTLVSACCWLISSQSKGFRLSRSPCTSTALLPVPGEEACPAFEILLSPCHLSMHEGLADREPCASYKTFQLNKHKVSCKATEKKQMSDRCYHAEFQKRICAMWKKKEKKKKPDRAQIVTELCKIWEKNTLAQVKTTKLSLIVLTQGILKPIPSQHNGYGDLANKYQLIPLP